MDIFYLLHVGEGGIGRHDVGNQMGKLLLTSLSEMHFVPEPGEVAFVSIMRLVVIRRAQRQVCRRQIVLVAQVDDTILVKELLHPSSPQPIYLWKLTQVSRSLLAPDLSEQPRAILSDLLQ